jgi:hypothetical protein
MVRPIEEHMKAPTLPSRVARRMLDDAMLNVDRDWMGLKPHVFDFHQGWKVLRSPESKCPTCAGEGS